MSKQFSTRDTPADSWELFPDAPPLFDQRLTSMLNSLWTPSQTGSVYVPGADLVESNRQYVLDIDLPGVGKKDITIEVTGRLVSVSGTRLSAEPQVSLRRRTRATGAFAYAVILPTKVDEERVTAKLDAGVLHVELPKASDATATQIKID